MGVLIGDEGVVREAALAAEVAWQRPCLLALGAGAAAFAVAA